MKYSSQRIKCDDFYMINFKSIVNMLFNKRLWRSIASMLLFQEWIKTVYFIKSSIIKWKLKMFVASLELLEIRIDQSSSFFVD